MDQEPQQPADYLDVLLKDQNVSESFLETLKEGFQENPEFPSFPAAMVSLQEKINKSQVKLREVAEIINLDPGLTARVLALAKSAAFAEMNVVDAETALFRLGLKEARMMVMTSKIMDRFVQLSVEMDWSRFWIHSLLVARLTQAITELYQPAGYLEYASGLLHDTGKIILGHYFPNEFESILKEASKGEKKMYKLEQEVWGTDHATISAALCQKWGLNSNIVEIVRYHHTPVMTERQNQIPAYCLHVADSIANRVAENIWNTVGEEKEEKETEENGEEKKDAAPPPNRVDKHIEWGRFMNEFKFKLRREPDVWVLEEYEKTKTIVQALMVNYKEKKDQIKIGEDAQSSEDAATDWS